MPKPRPKPPKPAAAPRVRAWWIAAALLAAVFVVYGQVLHFDFINFDDPDYVTRNLQVRGGLSAAGIAWAFTSGYAANWFPLTWISHMLDCQLFGLDSGMHHLTNVVLHAIATLLLFAFLDRATGARWRSAFVAALFALHPLHVESVAWVSERKDTLNAVFWFLTLWTYVRYTERPSVARYLLVAAAFVLGLLSKPMIVTLPFVLLLLDFWPLRRRLPIGARIREKVPLFVLSAGASVATFVVQRSSGAVKAMETFPLGLRIENALVSYGMYLWKAVWPSGLAAFYPYPTGVAVGAVALAAAVVAAGTVAVVWARRRYPFLMVGWLWFLGTLVPVIGLVQVGVQSRADRYMYVPIVGLGIMVAWSVPQARWVGLAAAAACAAFAGVAWSQTGYWQNSETLFRHALAVTTDNALAEHNLADTLLDDPARLPEAISHLETALRLQPDSAQAHTDLGTALAKSGRLPEAIEQFQAALRLLPGSAIVHNDLANALLGAGRLRPAIAEYERALELDPAYETARKNLAVAHNDLGSTLGESSEAIAEFQASLKLDPASAETHFNLGLALAKAHRNAEAVAQLEEALRLKPDYADAHNNLGFLLSQMPGRLPEALSHFEAAVRLRPDDADALSNLEIARQQLKRGR